VGDEPVGSTMTRKDSYFETPADIMKDGSGGFGQPQSMCICKLMLMLDFHLVSAMV
jgi:hypothetical protein